MQPFIYEILGSVSLPGQYPVQLNEMSDHTYQVAYGAQVSAFLLLPTAWEEFTSCLRHASECAGFVDIEE